MDLPRLMTPILKLSRRQKGGETEVLTFSRDISFYVFVLYEENKH